MGENIREAWRGMKKDLKDSFRHIKENLVAPVAGLFGVQEGAVGVGKRDSGQAGIVSGMHIHASLPPLPVSSIPPCLPPSLPPSLPVLGNTVLGNTVLTLTTVLGNTVFVIPPPLPPFVPPFTVSMILSMSNIG